MDAAAIIDTILDRSIVGGYSSIGYRLRASRWDEELPRMDGQVAVVTGATSGLGTAAAAAFAALGASVRMLVRSEERGERTRAEIIAQTGNEDVRLVIADLADLGQVRAAAEELLADDPRLDVLVNNAGVLPAERSQSADGHELTFATNVLAPFLLTNLLLPRLREGTRGRVITVSSGGMYAQPLKLGTLIDPPQPWSGTDAYARTKRAEVVFTELWAEREELHDGPRVMFASMHPGWADTAGVKSSLPRFYQLTKPLLRTPAQGADTIVWLGAPSAPGASAPETGRFWHDRATRPTHYLPWQHDDPVERRELWAACERLTSAHTE